MTSVHENRLSELIARVTAIDESIRQADEEYTTLAASFDTGDRASLKKAAQIEDVVTSLRRERALAVAAQAKVAEQHHAEQYEAEQEQRRVALAEAKKHADEIMALHSEIDAAFLTLTSLLTRRHALLQQLASTNVVDRGLVMKLSNKSGPTTAACHAGLGKYLDLNAPAPGSLRPLASSNALFQGIGKDHGQPRVKLNGGGAK